MVDIKKLNINIEQKHIIKDLDLNIENGEFVVIVGPNGCGKSTLIKSIAKLIKHQEGSIVIDGRNHEEYSKVDLAKKIAYLMQFSATNHDFTVRELVSYGRMPYAKRFHKLTAKDYEIVDKVIKQSGIEDLKDHLVKNLSGGERQRVHLALALAQEPELLILDEPTNHLDIKYQYELLNLVQKLNKEENITVLCVLHDLSQALRYADKIIIMKDGQKVLEGQPSCLDEQIIKEVYGVNCKIICNDQHQYVQVC